MVTQSGHERRTYFANLFQNFHTAKLCPICDAQFNHLLEQRSKVRNALHALETGVFVPTPRMPAPADHVESR